MSRARHSISSGAPAAVATYVTSHPLSNARRTANALFPELTGPVTKMTAIVRSGLRRTTRSGLPPARAEPRPSMAINILSVAAGIVLVVLTLNDIFQSVVVPRATGRRFRISFYVWRSAWRIWPHGVVATLSATTAIAAKISWRSSRPSCCSADRTLGRAADRRVRADVLGSARGPELFRYILRRRRFTSRERRVLTIGFGDVVGRAGQRGSSPSWRDSPAFRCSRSTRRTCSRFSARFSSARPSSSRLPHAPARRRAASTCWHRRILADRGRICRH